MESCNPTNADRRDPVELISSRQLAKILGVHPNRPAMWRQAGQSPVPPIRVGPRAIRYRMSDVIAMLDRNALGTPAPSRRAVSEATMV